MARAQNIDVLPVLSLLLQFASGELRRPNPVQRRCKACTSLMSRRLEQGTLPSSLMLQFLFVPQESTLAESSYNSSHKQAYIAEQIYEPMQVAWLPRTSRVRPKQDTQQSSNGRTYLCPCSDHTIVSGGALFICPTPSSSGLSGHTQSYAPQILRNKPRDSPSGCKLRPTMRVQAIGGYRSCR